MHTKSNKDDEKWLYEYSTDNYMNANNPEVRQAKKELLKQGYSKTKRAFEITWTIMVVILFPLALYNVASNFTFSNLSAIVIGIFLGIIFADFSSGVVHWAADTWGTLEVPFFGSTFIRSFREHHVSPTAMCEHDWFETNGDNFMLVVIPLFLLMRKNLMENSENGIPAWWDMFSVTFWIAAAMSVALTNQFHKWAHTHRPPSYVTFLQKYRIILPKEIHTQHHKPAFDGSYCITTGWLNPLLDALGFWRFVEKYITMITGLIPREDDWKWTGLVPANPTVVEKYMTQKNKNF